MNLDSRRMPKTWCVRWPRWPSFIRHGPMWLTCARTLQCRVDIWRCAADRLHLCGLDLVRIAIAGIGELPQGRSPLPHTMALHERLAKLAMDDAAIERGA